MVSPLFPVVSGLTVSLASAALALLSGAGAAGPTRAPRPGGTHPRAVVKPVEDVFLLTGELRAVRSYSLVTPRGEGELQIRWMVEDGAEVKEGERLVEPDASRLIQTIEESRLRLRQARNDRESRERSTAAEAERKRVAVDKAEVEVEKARIDAVVPRELRPAVEWARFQAAWQERKAALEKARLEREAYAFSSSTSSLSTATRSLSLSAAAGTFPALAVVLGLPQLEPPLLDRLDEPGGGKAPPCRPVFPQPRRDRRYDLSAPTATPR